RSLRLRNYWINRKNCCAPEMGLVTVFWPLTRTGSGDTGAQIAGGMLGVYAVGGVPGTYWKSSTVCQVWAVAVWVTRASKPARPIENMCFVFMLFLFLR